MFPSPVRPVMGTFVLDLARYINKKENVTILSPVPVFPWSHKTEKYKDYDMIPRKLCLEGLNVYYPRFFMIPKFLKSTDGFFYAVCVFLQAIRYLIKTDLIIAHWTFPDAFSCIIWKRLIKRKLVLVVHGNESIHYYEPPSLKKYLIGKTIKNVDHIVAVSNDLRKKIIEKYKVPSNKISVIPNGVDFNKFVPKNKKDARKKLNLPVGKKIFITVARLSPEKNLSLLLDAFSMIKKESQPLLYIIGDGPEFKSLYAKIKSENMENNVNLMGAIPHEEIHLWMSAADFFVLPSKREGTPVVIGEAFACGTPVIASSVGGIPDLINSNELGILTQPDSVSSLCEALRTALKKEWDREVIKDAGLKLDWKDIADRYLEVIHSV